MGIKEYSEELRKRKISFTIQEKNFSKIGYWQRTIKTKLRSKEIKNINMNIEIEYLE